ncbi:hypothetical protein cand_019490 [Cryptosporidium andersoni]|uniref:DUF4042 domain-containing protein n=1 Tax=Cryptosporidium andersoni TaxID=117008 RepID=A0A1J4MT44_9CRYT|nr:hypothetical protein cand_019490 [Cryptosporidium andersoni]
MIEIDTTWIINITDKCEHFLKQFSGYNKLNNEYIMLNSRVIISICNELQEIKLLINFIESNSNNTISDTKILNLILRCYQIGLEKFCQFYHNKDINLSNSLENNFSNILLNPGNGSTNDEDSNVNYEKGSNSYLSLLLKVLKDLNTTIDYLKYCTNINTGILCATNTVTLSIILLLLRFTIPYKILNRHFEYSIHIKIQILSLQCLEKLFRIYKLELTDKWNMILYPEFWNNLSNNYTSNYTLDILLHSSIAILKNISNPVPIIAISLFSNNSKIRVASIHCIQAIFECPLLRSNNIRECFNGYKINSSFVTTSQLLSDIIKDLIILLLQFGQHLLDSDIYCSDTITALLRVLSNCITKTPSILWINDQNINNSLIYSLSLFLNLAITKEFLMVPVFQLLSNLLNSNILQELPLEIVLKLFRKLFFNAIKTTHIYIILINDNNTLKYTDIFQSNSKYYNLYNKSPDLYIREGLNIILKCLDTAPFLLIPYVNESQVTMELKESQNLLFSILNILLLDNFEVYESMIYLRLFQILESLLKIAINYKKSLLLFKNEAIELDYSLNWDDNVDINCNNRNRKINFTTEFYNELWNFVQKLQAYIFSSQLEFWRYILSGKYPSLNKTVYLNNMELLPYILNFFSYIFPQDTEDMFQDIIDNRETSFLAILINIFNNLNDNKLLICTIQCLMTYYIHSDSITYIPSIFYTLLGKNNKVSDISIRNLLENYIITKLVEILNNNKHQLSINIENIVINSIITISLFQERDDDSIMNYLNNCKQLCITAPSIISVNYTRNNQFDKLNKYSTYSNWLSMLQSFKYYIESNKLYNNLKITLKCNSQLIRVLGYISRLIIFEKYNNDILLWVLNLLNNTIQQSSDTSLRIKKLKWNAIYAIGMIFMNSTFKELLKSDFSILKIYMEIWDNLCKIISNKSEFVKVRLNAIRTLIMYGFDHYNPIPHDSLEITWKTWIDINKMQICYYINNKKDMNYTIEWKKASNALFNILSETTKLYIENKDNLSIDKRSIFGDYIKQTF